MNRKTLIPLVIAIALGVLAAKLGRDMLESRRTNVPTPRNLVKVAVAAVALPPGHELRAEDVKLSEVSKDAAPANAFSSPTDLVGRVTATALVPGQAILENLLAARGVAGGLSALVPEGMRAVTLEVNEFSGVAGLLVPGCRVDVVSSLHDSESGITVARTIVENVKVQAVGQQLTAPAKPDDRLAVPRSVTLIVTPEDAEAIELASNSGRTRLMLRGAGDDAPVHTRGVTVARLIGDAVKRPGPATRPLQQVDADQPAAGAVRPAIASTTRPAPSLEDPWEVVMRHRVRVLRAGVPSHVEFEIRRVNRGNDLMTGSGPEAMAPWPLRGGR